MALARAYDSLDWSNLSLGRPTGDYWGLALEIYEELDDVGGQSGILLNLGAGLFYEGKWDDALASYERARDGRLKVGDPVMAALAADNIAEIECERGRFGEAEELLRDSLRLWRASENRYMLGNCLEFLARVTSRTGRTQEALELLTEAQAALHSGGRRGRTCYVLKREWRNVACSWERRTPPWISRRRPSIADQPRGMPE